VKDIFKILIKLISNFQANNDPIYTVLLIGVLVLVVVVPVMGISGGMFNPLLVSISPTFYEQLLHLQIAKNTVKPSVFWRFRDLSV
jgi:hypothetical protein